MDIDLLSLVRTSGAYSFSQKLVNCSGSHDTTTIGPLHSKYRERRVKCLTANGTTGNEISLTVPFAERCFKSSDPMKSRSNKSDAAAKSL
jgi:hypothetical protein